MDIQNMQMRDVVIVFLICAAAAVSAAIALLVLAAKQIQDLDIPENADFFETLQAVPVTVPIALDLLDFAFDVFSAPISWIILEMMGLSQLKAITLVEGLVPGTQLIPTMTIAWVVSRTFMKKNVKSPFRDALREQQLATRGQYPRLGRGGKSSRADMYRQRALPPGRRSGTVGDQVVVDGESLDLEPRSRRPRLPGGISTEAEDAEFYDDSLPTRRGGSAYDDAYDGEDFADGEEF